MQELVAKPDLAALVRAASRLVAASGLVIIGSAVSGCADPVCTGSRTEELTMHGERALREVGSLHLYDGLKEIGIAVGITPHPVMPVAGAMPVLLPPPVPPAPSGGTGGP